MTIFTKRTLKDLEEISEVLNDKRTSIVKMSNEQSIELKDLFKTALRVLSGACIPDWNKAQNTIINEPTQAKEVIEKHDSEIRDDPSHHEHELHVLIHFLTSVDNYFASVGPEHDVSSDPTLCAHCNVRTLWSRNRGYAQSLPHLLILLSLRVGPINRWGRWVSRAASLISAIWASAKVITVASNPLSTIGWTMLESAFASASAGVFARAAIQSALESTWDVNDGRHPLTKLITMSTAGAPMNAYLQRFRTPKDGTGEFELVRTTLAEQSLLLFARLLSKDGLFPGDISLYLGTSPSSRIWDEIYKGGKEGAYIGIATPVVGHFAAYYAPEPMGPAVERAATFVAEHGKGVAFAVVAGIVFAATQGVRVKPNAEELRNLSAAAAIGAGAGAGAGAAFAVVERAAAPRLPEPPAPAPIRQPEGLEEGEDAVVPTPTP